MVVWQGQDRLELVGRQLWAAALESGLARVDIGRWPVPAAPGSAPGWVEQESYWVVPDAGRARLLVPAGDRGVTARALSAYHRLRPPREAAARRGLALVARTGLPVGASRLRLLVQADAATRARALLPLSVATEALGLGPLAASIGVRTGPNGKPTLHLVDRLGGAVGYAKWGWNPHTDAFVTTEAAVLEQLSGGTESMSVPRVLAAGRSGQHSWLITQPLPEAAQALRGRGARISPQELMALAPLTRHDRLSATGQWRGMLDRLGAGLEQAPVPVLGPLRELLALLGGAASKLPVVARWHGDLTPWNCAREPGGRLWCWDWETSEPDVVAGLDALHWAFSVRRERAGGPDGVRLRDCLDDADLHLRAAGVPARSFGLVAAAYAVTVAERAVSLAARAGWDRAWISPVQVGVLLEEGRGLAYAAQPS